MINCFRKGKVLKILIVKPKKPNSGNRKIAKCLILPNKIIKCYIPGERSTLNIHNNVLIKHSKIKDLPGIKYRILRGVYDSNPVLRRNSRSKYGCKKI